MRKTVVGSMEQIVRIWRQYCRALTLVWIASPQYAVLTCLFTLLSASIPPLQIWMMKVIVDRVSTQVALFDGDLEAAIGFVAVPLGVLTAIWILGGFSTAISNVARELLSLRMGNHIEARILEKAASLDIAFYENPHFYDQMENARQEANGRPVQLTMSLFDMVQKLVTAAAMFGFLVRLHPGVALLLLVTAFPQLIGSAYYNRKIYQAFTEHARARRFCGYISYLLTSKDFIKETRLFQLAEPLIRRFRSSWEVYFSAHKKVQIARQKVDVSLNTASCLGIAGAWAYAAWQAVIGRITLGDIMLYFRAAENARGTLYSVFSTSGKFYQNSLFLNNLFEFLDLEPDAVEGALRRDDSKPLLPAPRSVSRGIEFQDVSFCYPQMEEPVIKDLSFKIEPGETVALVGKNGAGKTTLVKLLTRLYDPTSGRILLEGRDLRDYDLEDLYGQIGVIFQNFACYNLSARENIGFGCIDALDDMERIADAARQGGVMPVINRLPQGFETVLGRMFEKGADLSGGEWQKLALGRALVRQAQILVLDEPTAALDALAEYEVYKNFTNLVSERIVVLISHRFSTVRMADHILVMGDGTLVEEGNHDQLLALDGLYAQMFIAQAVGYR